MTPRLPEPQRLTSSTPGHQKLPVEIATGGIVLLKNSGDVLPLSLRV